MTDLERANQIADMLRERGLRVSAGLCGTSITVFATGSRRESYASIDVDGGDVIIGVSTPEGVVVFDEDDCSIDRVAILLSDEEGR